MANPDFGVKHLPFAVKQSMIDYGFLSPTMKLMPNYKSNAWNGVFKKQTRNLCIDTFQLLHSNLWSNVPMPMCGICKEQAIKLPHNTRGLPVLQHCACRAVKPENFTGDSRPYYVFGNKSAFWCLISPSIRLTRPMPPPIPLHGLKRILRQPANPRDPPDRQDMVPMSWSRLFISSIILQFSAADAWEAQLPGKDVVFPIKPPVIPDREEEGGYTLTQIAFLGLMVINTVIFVYMAYKYIRKAIDRRRHNSIAMRAASFQRNHHRENSVEEETAAHTHSANVSAIHCLGEQFAYNTVDAADAPCIDVMIGVHPFRGATFKGILDSGTNHTVLTEALFKQIPGYKSITRVSASNLTLVSATDTTIRVLFQVTLNYTFSDTKTELKFSEPFTTVVAHSDDMSEDLFIGTDILSSRIVVYQTRRNLFISATPLVKRSIKVEPRSGLIKMNIRYNITRTAANRHFLSNLNMSNSSVSDFSNSTTSTDSDKYELPEEIQERKRRKKQDQRGAVPKKPTKSKELPIPALRRGEQAAIRAYPARCDEIVLPPAGMHQAAAADSPPSGNSAPHRRVLFPEEERNERYFSLTRAPPPLDPPAGD
jgi:hypothetical protein